MKRPAFHIRKLIDYQLFASSLSLIESIISGGIAYEDLTVNQQAVIYETLLAKRGKPPEALLLAASQKRPPQVYIC